ncbi:hypothetical protein UlMin_027158 [Ulmus minor]
MFFLQKICKGAWRHPLKASNPGYSLVTSKMGILLRAFQNLISGEDMVGSDFSFGGEFLEPLHEYHIGPSYPHDFGFWSNFFFDSQKVPQQSQMTAYDGQYYTFSAVSQVPYAPFNTFSQSYPNEFQFQDFQYFDKNPHPQEIIEFPSVIVSSVTGQLEACFETYVRPTCNQFLSDFCKDLTGIQQIQVDRGVTLSEALLKHDKWLEIKGIKNTNFAVVTWSNWDWGVMLEAECRFKKKIRKPPYFNRVELIAAWMTQETPPNSSLSSCINSLMWQATDPPMTTWTPSPELPSFSPHQLYMLNDTNVPQCQYLPYCSSGVRSSKGMVRKPGSMKGSSFFSCGNWTAT